MIDDWLPLDGDLPKGLTERQGLEGNDCDEDDNGDQDGNSGSSEEDVGNDTSTGSTANMPASWSQTKYSVSMGEESASHISGKEFPTTMCRQQRIRLWYCVSSSWPRS